MSRSIFVNLPVKDLNRSKSFFEAIGYSFNPQFTDETAACLVISDTIFAMLLTHPKYAQFTKKEIADTQKTSAALICLSRDSRADVDVEVDAALKAGGTEARDPEDHGFMYSRGYCDLDGHTWEIMWMDQTAVQPT